MFDFDGTLADTLSWLAHAVNRLAAAYGCNRIEAGDLDALRGSSARGVVAHLGIPAWRLPRIGVAMRRLIAADIGQIRLFDGIGGMLRGLSDRGAALAVVTSNADDNVRHVLGAEHAARISDYACGASLFGKRGHLRRVLKQSGVRPGEAIVIRDELRDLEAARAACSTASIAVIDTHRGKEPIMTPDGARADTEAIVERVKAWKRSRVGRKPSFRDYKVYYRSMRWGPFSYWTWRGIIILISGALLVYVVLFRVCLSGGDGCAPSVTWNPLTWFLRPVP